MNAARLDSARVDRTAGFERRVSNGVNRPIADPVPSLVWPPPATAFQKP